MPHVTDPLEIVPHLDQRLRIVASHIRWRTHADIGSDHGHLLKALLKARRIERAIAIENKTLPWENSRRTLANLAAEVRLADGLEGLGEGEVDGLSVCGMGGPAITRILDRHPERVPATIILQPNCKAELVRRWALRHCYDLVDESMAVGSVKRVKLAHRADNSTTVPRYRFIVLRFEKLGTQATGQQPHRDAAYEGLDREAAILFGPRLIRAWHHDFVDSLLQEQAYLSSHVRLGDESARRLSAIRRLISSQA